MTSKVISF